VLYAGATFPGRLWRKLIRHGKILKSLWILRKSQTLRFSPGLKDTDRREGCHELCGRNAPAMRPQCARFPSLKMHDDKRLPNAERIKSLMVAKGMTRYGKPHAMALFNAMPDIPEGGASPRKIQMIVAGEGRHNVHVFHALANVLGATFEQVTLPESVAAQALNEIGDDLIDRPLESGNVGTAVAIAEKEREIEIDYERDDLGPLFTLLHEVIEESIYKIKLRIKRIEP
jgi:hypothetical protein